MSTTMLYILYIGKLETIVSEFEPDIEGCNLDY